MEEIIQFINRLVREDEGQDMVEYVLIFGLVSIISIPLLIALGPSIDSLWGPFAGIIAGAF